MTNKEFGLGADIKIALDALRASKPTHNQYPEARERHERAIKACERALNVIWGLDQYLSDQ